MKTTLAGRLKEARAARGLTQKALGDLVGVSQAAIQKIETGKASQTTKLVEIANALGVMPDWLSSGEGAMLNDGKQSGAALLTNAASDVFRVDVLDLTVSAGPGSFMISEFVEVLHAIEFTNEHARALTSIMTGINSINPLSFFGPGSLIIRKKFCFVLCSEPASNNPFPPRASHSFATS